MFAPARSGDIQLLCPWFVACNYPAFADANPRMGRTRNLPVFAQVIAQMAAVEFQSTARLGTRRPLLYVATSQAGRGPDKAAFAWAMRVTQATITWLIPVIRAAVRQYRHKV